MKPLFKISPSILDQFHSFMSGDYEKWGKTQEDFRQYVLGVYAPNLYASKGTAVHAVIEGVETSPNVHEESMQVTWNFAPDAWKTLQTFRERFKDASMEVWNHTTIESTKADVHMNMRYDALDGLVLHDFKTSAKPKHYGDYFNSLQWRCYLLSLPDIHKVMYHAITVPNSDPEKVIDKLSIASMEFLRQPNNDQMVMYSLSHLIDWIMEDEQMYAKLLIDTDKLKAEMAGIVQSVYDGTIDPQAARVELEKKAFNYERMQPYLDYCLTEIKTA